jgi:uncharacterized integral membrane protein
MIRLVLAILSTVSAVVFVMANTHQVELSFVIGAPVRVRLIFLLMLTFMTGVVTAWLWSMIAHVRSHRRVQAAVRHERAAAAAAAAAAGEPVPVQELEREAA